MERRREGWREGEVERGLGENDREKVEREKARGRERR